jgi:hypothetical protein
MSDLYREATESDEGGEFRDRLLWKTRGTSGTGVITVRLDCRRDDPCAVVVEYLPLISTSQIVEGGATDDE